MAKVMLVGGGPGRRPMTWEVSGHAKLKRDYVFRPGIPTQVLDDDALVLLSPEAVGGRVFELVDEAPARAAPPPDARRPAPPASRPAEGKARAAGEPPAAPSKATPDPGSD